MSIIGLLPRLTKPGTHLQLDLHNAEEASLGALVAAGPRSLLIGQSMAAMVAKIDLGVDSGFR